MSDSEGDGKEEKKTTKKKLSLGTKNKRQQESKEEKKDKKKKDLTKGSKKTRTNKKKSDDSTNEHKTGSRGEPPRKVAERYQKMTLLESILKRPDTYVGSVTRETESLFVFDMAT